MASNRYNEMIVLLRKQDTVIDGLLAIINSLQQTPNDSEWQELNDKIKENTKEIEDALLANTPQGNGGDAGNGNGDEGPLPSAGGAKPSE